MKNYFLNLKLSLIILLILIIPAFLPIIHQGFFPSQDYVYIARIFEMNRSLQDGNFPVRWASDLRYGEPLFNFYAPLPYYVGAFIQIIVGFFGVTLSFVLISKILLILGFILAGLAMFFLARELFGNLGGIVAALLYTYAPYHSVDVYVRGALSEHWALIFFPLIFLFSYKLSQVFKKSNIALLALSLAGLFYTHNVMTLIFLPFFFVWIGFWFWQRRTFKYLLWCLVAFVLGIGLAASFLIPAFIEREFIQTAYLNSGYFDFRAHFVQSKQLFSTFWGYGASVWGGEDMMSFQVGLSHWMILLISLVLALIIILKKKGLLSLQIIEVSPEKLSKSLLIVFLSGCFLVTLFMMHNKSAFVWEEIPVLAFVQFPWRFLAVSIFFISIIGGYLFIFNKKVWLLIGICILIFVFNFNYFKPEKYYDESFFDQFTDLNKLVEGYNLPKDYLPIWVESLERELVTAPHFVEGEGEITDYKIKSGKASLKTISSDGGAVEVPITYFPGWQAEINQKTVQILEPDKFGLIRFSVPPGESKVMLNLRDTNIRLLGNFLSMISFVAILFLLVMSSPNFKKLWKN